MVRMAAGALVFSMATMAVPAVARGHHGGFHGHRGFGFHAHPHCRTFRDQNGLRQRVCV